MKKLCYSSDLYYIRVSDLLALNDAEVNIGNSKDLEAGILVNKDTCKLCFNRDYLLQKDKNDFVKTRVFYYSYPLFIGFLINFVKKFKRKSWVMNDMSFRVLFDELIDANLTRCDRTRENAYDWTSKRWRMSREQANKRYNDLYKSLKENGYDEKYPMIVLINRKLGVKDQIYQGHHRSGICKEVGIKEVNICFGLNPMSFDFLRLFTKKR